jgi:3-dehydroquinate dehydratase-2
MKKIIVINGPNLNLLGNREGDIYGDTSLDDIKIICEKKSKDLNLYLFFCQSNNEGDLINYIHSAQDDFDGIIINPAAFTHTSIALLDALRAIDKPKIEIHLSNIYNREDYRKRSITSEGVNGLICGFGSQSYILAIEAISKLI